MGGGDNLWQKRGRRKQGGALRDPLPSELLWLLCKVKGNSGRKGRGGKRRKKLGAAKGKKGWQKLAGAKNKRN
jgi:hypothetical protein